MKHHFSDYLFREFGHWKMTPNSDRHRFSVGSVRAPSNDITILIMGKNDKNWQIIFDVPELQELTLHDPSKEQLAALPKVDQLKRLRITHCRPEDLTPLSKLQNVSELVLGSGFITRT